MKFFSISDHPSLSIVDEVLLHLRSSISIHLRRSSSPSQIIHLALFSSHQSTFVSKIDSLYPTTLSLSSNLTLSFSHISLSLSLSVCRLAKRLIDLRKINSALQFSGTKETRLFFPSPLRPLCNGLYMGSSPLKPAIRRNTVDYVPDSILFSPRNYSNATWRSFLPKFARLYHDNKFHNQDNLSRYIVARSELVGTGTPDASYPFSAPHSGSKIRGICFYAVTSVAAVFLFVLMLVAHPFILLLDRYRRKAHYLIAKIWALATVTPFIEFEYEGLENLPAPDTPAVYVSNHQSFLDIYTLLTLGRSFKFISKTSIFYYPVIGWAMFLMGVIPLKRMDSRSQLECLKRCMDLVKKGASVFFFPEGTRSKDGNLGAFKKGAFSIAAKTGVAVVPITINGTGKIMPTGSESILNPGSVRVVIHKPIEGNDPEVLCHEARNIIAGGLLHQG